MGKKPYAKILIDGTEYHQIRKDNTQGEAVWWKNQPQTSAGVIASGLHVINGKPNDHYDYYENRQEIHSIQKKYVQKKIGGTFLSEKGIFVMPSDKVLIMNKSAPTFISQEEFEKNKHKYRLVNPKPNA